MSSQRIKRARKIKNDLDPDIEPLFQSTSQGPYRIGSVKRVILHNFVTFDDVDFTLGPRLNVIVGPNGAGKSTIVNGIAIGLASKPKDIGRATQLSYFVKRGCETGWVELYLHQGDNLPDFVIRRIISYNSESSRWKSNYNVDNITSGCSCACIDVTQAFIVNRIKSFEIRIDNLCQFLPQDRVAEFSEMTPQTLLEEVEKTVDENRVSDPTSNLGSELIKRELWSKHQNLVELGLEQQRREISSQRNSSRIEEMEKSLTNMEADLKRFRERQKLETRLREMENFKRPYLQFQRDRDFYDQLKDQRNKVKETLDKIIKADAPARARLVSLTKNNKTLKDNYFKLLESNKKNNKMVEKNRKILTQISDNADLKNRSLGEIKKNRTKYENRKARYENQIKELENSIQELKENSRDPEADKVNIKKLQREAQEIEMKISDCQDLVHTKQQDLNPLQSQLRSVTNRLKTVKDSSYQVIQNLKKFSPIVENLWRVINSREAKERLGDRVVYGPVGLYIKVNDRKISTFIENSINKKHLCAFVVEDVETQEMVMDIFKSAFKSMTNIMVAFVGSPPYRVKHEVLLNDYYRNELGVADYLDGMYSAPPQVKEFFRSMARTHEIAIIPNIEPNEKKMILLQKQFKIFMTKSSIYKVSRERYGKRETFLSVKDLRPSVILSGLGDAESQIRDLEERKHSLETEINKINEECSLEKRKENELRNKITILNKERDILRSRQGGLNKAEKKLDLVEQKLKDLEKDSKQYDTSIEKTQKELLDLLISHKDTFNTITGGIKTFSESTTNLLNSHFELVDNERSRRLASEILDKSKAHIAKLEEEKGLISQEISNIKTKIRESKKIYDKSVEGLTLEDQNRIIFNSGYPDNLEDLEISITQERQNIEMAFHINPEIVNKYEEMRKNLEEIRSKHVSDEQNRKKHFEMIEAAKQEWLSGIQNVADIINEKFSQFFSSMNCVGQVSIKIPENQLKFSDYGLKIMVKFSEHDKLASLTRTRQSGGERSVSTMIFLLALQDITSTPFRIVDEINQGMDANNERRIFEQLSKMSTRDDSPQYTLVTPKLLPNLNFTKRMSVVFVLTGSGSVGQDDWNKYLNKKLNKQV